MKDSSRIVDNCDPKKFERGILKFLLFILYYLDEINEFVYHI